MLGGGVSHPSQLTTGLVIKSVTTSPTLAGERMLFILQVSILSEQILVYGRKGIFGCLYFHRKTELKNTLHILHGDSESLKIEMGLIFYSSLKIIWRLRG